MKVAGSPSPSLNLIRFLSLFSIFIICTWEGGPTRQGGRIWGGLPERSSTKESYFVANIVLSWFTCFLKGFRRAFNKSQPAFIELSTKVILISERFQRDCLRSAFGEQKSSRFLTTFFATIDMANLKFLQALITYYSQPASQPLPGQGRDWYMICRQVFGGQDSWQELAPNVLKGSLLSPKWNFRRFSERYLTIYHLPKTKT